MIDYKLTLLLTEGLIFGLLAIGIYIAFKWLRFPDLTPDGSFALGAVAYVKMVSFGVTPFLSLLIAVISGASAGALTAGVNRYVRIPTVVAGLLVASSLYSINWLILQKPNQNLIRSLTLVGDIPGLPGALRLLLILTLICLLVILAITIFSTTIWGLRIRAIGENPLLAHDIGSSETKYTFIGLMLANSIVGLAGALFAQRSYSADINMGIGMTITGLAGMVLGLIMASKRQSVRVVLLAVIIGSVLYKTALFLALELGLPGESFRLISAGVLIITYFAVRFTSGDILKGLKWN